MIDTLKRYLRIVEHILLVVALICSGIWFHRYNSEKQARQTAEIAAKGLPSGTLAEYILKNRELLEEVKNAKGKTVVKTVYVPDEGGVQVVTKEKEALQAKYNALMAQLLAAKTPSEITAIQKDLAGVANQIDQSTTVSVKTWGFTSRFGYGMIVSPSVKTTIPYNGGSLSLPVTPSLDWKWGYAGRYSGILQINPYFWGPGLTYHIDNLMPQFLHINNLELGITGGPGWLGGKFLGLDLRNNF
jgi:hypothetical protein